MTTETIRHTPRTDALAATAIGFYSCETVPAYLARGLEQENQQLREENLRLFGALRNLVKGLDAERKAAPWHVREAEAVLAKSSSD